MLRKPGAETVVVRAQPDHQQVRRGAMMMVGAMLAFACLDAARKQLSSELPTTQIMMFRYLFFIVVVIAWLPRRGTALIRTQRPWLQLARSVVILVETGTFILALSHASLADAHSVFALAPIAGVLLSIVLLRERVDRATWLVLGASFVGIMVILQPGFTSPQPGLVLSLVSAVLFALYGVLTRMAGAHDSPDTSFFHMTVVGLVATVALGFADWVPPSPSDWFFLVLTGVGALVGQYLMIAAYAAASASTLQPYNYFLFVWAVLISLVFFGAAPTVPALIGGLVVAISGAVLFLRRTGPDPAGQR